MKFRVFLVVFILTVLSVQNLFSNEIIKLSASPSKTVVKKGEDVYLKVSVEIAEHYYTYSNDTQLNEEGVGPAPTEMVVSPNDKFDTLKISYSSEPIVKYDEGFEMDIKAFKGKSDFYILLKAKEDIDFSKDEINAGLFLQLCDTVSCLPPAEHTVKVGSIPFDLEAVDFAKLVKYAITYDEYGYPISIPVATGSEESTSQTTGQTKTTSALEIEKSREEGVMSFLFLAMAAGGAALLTPCVFPMVPITVSFFTKRSEKKPGRGLVDSLVYSLGIVITFTLIGFLVSLIWGATGIRDLASNGFINLFITLIFIIFALNLFGAFEIQIPPKLLNYLNAKSQSGGGMISVILMSVTFSLTSFTCTVPFVAAALGSASTGEWFHPIIGMLGFSAVFAAPFFLLALFPSYLNKLPKAGGWMNNVKVVMGFLEIAAAIKFLSNADLVWGWGVIPREVFLAIWVACGILVVIYILGVFKLPHDAEVKSIGPARLMITLLFASITIWLFTGLFDKQLGELDAFLPPKEYDVLMGSASASSVISSTDGSSTVIAEESWYKSYDAALEEAKRTNTPIFIDFTGVTCTNCRWMESNMFTKPAVASRMNKMIKAKLYTDRRNVESDQFNKQLQQDRYGSVELPLYVILTPDEELIASETFNRSEAEFIEFLDKAFK